MIQSNTLTQIHLFYPALFLFGIIVTFIISRAFKDKLDAKKDIHFKDKDTEITSCILAKYPNVSHDYLAKTQREQTIENNQEIHKIEKRLEAIEEYIRSRIKANDTTH